MGYSEIIKLIDDNRYLDADRALVSVSSEDYQSNRKLADLLQVMIYSEIKSRNDQLELLRKLRKRYRDEVFDLYFQLVRMELMLKKLDRERADVLLDLLERKFEQYEEEDAYEMYLMEKAEYYYDSGEYSKALSTLNSFDGDLYPCPLMYYELLTQVLIKLNNSAALESVLKKVESIKNEHQPLDLEKQETYLSIKIKIALHKKDQVDCIEFVNAYISVLDQIQKPFGYNHLELCQYLSQLGYSKEEIERMTRHYTVTEVSQPYLKKRSGLQGKTHKNPNHLGEILLKR